MGGTLRRIRVLVHVDREAAMGYTLRRPSTD
eukprot:SAG31_NODE_1777_length_7299_cov_60.190694_6_plen_30_part_01